MGPQMLSYGLFGTALAYLHRVITIKRMPHQALAIFITVLLADAVAYFLAFLKGQPIAPNIHTALLGISLYSSLVGPFLFLPSAWWIRIKTNRVRRSLR
jgi:cell shape-determining protein MreD